MFVLGVSAHLFTISVIKRSIQCQQRKHRRSSPTCQKMSVNESFFNLAPPVDTRRDEDAESEITFITIVLAIVIAWILVALWTRVIENLTFGTLGLNGDSFWHALIIAITITVIFFVVIWVIDKYQLIRGDIEQDVEGLDSPLSSTDNVISGSGPSESNRNGTFIPSNI